MSSSRDPLRLVHLAEEHGVGWMFARALQKEIFAGNGDAFGHDAPSRLGAELGVPVAEIDTTLAGDGYTENLRIDREEARMLGARGIPFTVFGGAVVLQGGAAVPDYLEAIERAVQVIDGERGPGADGPAVVDGIQCAAR